MRRNRTSFILRSLVALLACPPSRSRGLFHHASSPQLTQTQLQRSLARLEALHIVTNRNFDAEVSMPVGRVDVVPVSLPAVTAASVGDTSQPPAAPPQTGLDLHPDQSVANCSSSAFGVTGLVNLGNTCYINTIIQCFLSLPQIRNYYISDLFLQNLKPTGKTKR